MVYGRLKQILEIIFFCLVHIIYFILLLAGMYSQNALIKIFALVYKHTNIHFYKKIMSAQHTYLFIYLFNLGLPTGHVD